jgi:hypothetical protein
MGDVLELEPGAALGRRGEPDLDPAHLSAELPRGGEPVRWVTALHGASGVALQLVAPAEAQLAGHGQVPPREAIEAGAAVPYVVDARLTRLERAYAHPALHRVELVGDVNHVSVLSSGPRCRRSRRPRASSVANASRWGFQKVRTKSVRPHRLVENFDVLDFALTADEVAAIDAIDTGVRGGPDPDGVGPGDFS